MVTSLIIRIDYIDDDTKAEILVRFSDPVINKAAKFVEYDKASVEKELGKILKRHKVKAYQLVDTTGLF